ncbi:hypothetical protein PUN28_015636 [Cardiocondyla obscurior]|uniref:Uncharacterized protein n=1 Tax=Cardiocondyla obscurior TaxID=286306 RepID=A0AAW2F048_9HYME
MRSSFLLLLRARPRSSFGWQLQHVYTSEAPNTLGIGYRRPRDHLRPRAPTYDPSMDHRGRSRFAFDLRGPRSKLPKSMTKFQVNSTEDMWFSKQDAEFHELSLFFFPLSN